MSAELDLNWYYSFNQNHGHNESGQHAAMDKKSKTKSSTKRANASDNAANYSCPFGSCSKIYSSKLGLELHIQVTVRANS